MRQFKNKTSILHTILPFLLVFSLSPSQVLDHFQPPGNLNGLSVSQGGSVGYMVSNEQQVAFEETITLQPVSSETSTLPAVVTTETPTPEITQTPVPSETPTAIPTNTEIASLTPTAVVTPTQTAPGMVPIFVAKENLSFLESFSINLAGINNCNVAVELAKIGVTLAQVPAEDLETTLDTLEEDRNVLYAETVGEVQALEVIPNDPGFIYQTELRQIYAPQAWEVSTGSENVTIAVIDSGVDRNQPDLNSKLLLGCDFINQDDDPADDNGHGTHVAGIAAASGSDGFGMAGVSWGARILPVKVLDAEGDGNYATLAAGIIWAADHGVQIINLSLGGTSSNLTLKAAVDYALSKGVLIIAASGNDGAGSLRYPAGFSDVIAVGSVDVQGNHSSFSNFGIGLDLVAPGEEVYSIVPGGYERKSGTSMSVPYVSGLAAILWGLPDNANAKLIESEMERSAIDLGVYGWDEQYGYGLLRMDRAIQSARANRIDPSARKTKTPTQAESDDGVYYPTSASTLIPGVTPVAIEITPEGNGKASLIHVTPGLNQPVVQQIENINSGKIQSAPRAPMQASDSSGIWISMIIVGVCVVLISRSYPLEK